MKLEANAGWKQNSTALTAGISACGACICGFFCVSVSKYLNLNTSPFSLPLSFECGRLPFISASLAYAFG